MARKRLFRLQWDMQAMLLLTAVVAVWVPCFHLQERIARTEEKIDSMRNLARELIVDDPGKIAVVKQLETGWEENRWEIHLPDGEYAIRLATREIDRDGLSPTVGETRFFRRNASR